MAALVNVANSILCYFRATIVPHQCQICQTGDHIQFCQSHGSTLNGFEMIKGLLSYAKKKLILQLGGFFLCSKHFTFHLLKLIGDVALAIGNGLFPLVVRGHLIEVCLGHLYEVAKDCVEFDFKRRNVRILNFIGLKRCNPGLTISFGALQFIQSLMIASFDEMPFLKGSSRFFQNSFFDELYNFRTLNQFFCQGYQRSKRQVFHLGSKIFAMPGCP